MIGEIGLHIGQSTMESVIEEEKMVTANKDMRLRYAGEWKVDSNTGFRDLIVWMGVPWLLSFVICRKKMGFTMSFTDPTDPDTPLHIETLNGHSETVPTDGSSVNVLVKEPFERNVTCTCAWLGDDSSMPSMQLTRDDPEIGSMKKYGAFTTLTRVMRDSDTIESTISIRKLTDNTTKEAVVILKRQPPRRKD